MLRKERIRFTGRDRRRLSAAMRAVHDARHYRRLQAVWFVAQGHSAMEVAGLLECTYRWVNKWLARYRLRHRPEDLAEGTRSGRPRTGQELTAEWLLEVLQSDPRQWGYAATIWTVPLLVTHVGTHLGCALSEHTMRRRMRELGLRWKRPRYIFSEKEPHRAQKKGPSSANSSGCRLRRSF